MRLVQEEFSKYSDLTSAQIYYVNGGSEYRNFQMMVDSGGGELGYYYCFA